MLHCINLRLGLSVHVAAQMGMGLFHAAAVQPVHGLFTTVEGGSCSAVTPGDLSQQDVENRA